MSERVPSAPAEAEPANGDVKDKDKKKSKKVTAIKVPLFGAALKQPEKFSISKDKVDARRGEAIGSILVQRGEGLAGGKIDRNEKASVVPAGDTKEYDTRSDREKYWPEIELHGDEVYAGEVIIDLQHGEPKVILADGTTERIPTGNAAGLSAAETEPGPEPEPGAEPGGNPEADPGAEPAEPVGPDAQGLSAEWQDHSEASFQAQTEQPAEAAPPVSAGGTGGRPPVVPPVAPGPLFNQPPDPRNSFGYERPLEPAEAYRQYLQRQPEAATKADVQEAVQDAAKAGEQGWFGKGKIAGVLSEHLRHRRRERKNERRYRKQRKSLTEAQRKYEFGVRENERQQVQLSARFNTAENRYSDTEKRMEQRVQQAEQRAAQAEERLNVPAEHRLQTSAWHAIEVDAKTGKAVEKPSFQYGREYYRERAQEAGPAQQRNAAAGGIALAGAASPQQPQAQPMDSTTVAAPPIPNASTQGSPGAGKQPANGQQPTNDTNQAPLWPWLLALLIIAASLIFALG